MGCTRTLTLVASLLLVLSATSGCIVPEDMPALREELGYASVEQPDLVVKARATTLTPTVEQPVELSAEIEGLPLDAVELTWDVNGTTYEQATIEVSFAQPGTHPVELTATGPNGTSAEDAIQIEAIPNQAPEPELRVEDAGELWAHEPVVVRAEGSTDPDGDELSYDWRLDGEPVDAGPVLEADLEAGPHHVAVTVSDGHAEATREESFAVDQLLDREANLTAQDTETRFTVPVAASLETATLELTHTTQAGLDTVNFTLLTPDGEALVSTQTDPAPGDSQANQRIELDAEALEAQPHTLVLSLERGTEAVATIEGVFTYSPLPPAAG